MLDIPGAPELDKLTLIGGCLQSPLRVDAERSAGEVANLPESPWDGTGVGAGRSFCPGGDILIEERSRRGPG